MTQIVVSEPLTKIVVSAPNHALWLAMRLGLNPSDMDGNAGTVGHEDADGRVLAVTAFTGFRDYPETGRASCWASIAALPGVNWCTRRYLRAILYYPFEVLGVAVLRTTCAKTNKQARRFNEKIGMRQCGVARRSWDGRRDAMHYDMLPHEAAKWLGYEPTAWKERKESELSYG